MRNPLRLKNNFIIVLLSGFFDGAAAWLRKITGTDKELKKTKTLDKVKSEFISIAAHQLRTPLTKIKWSLKSLMSGDYGAVNPRQLEVLKDGYLSNEKMIKLINDLLDLSKLEDMNLGYSFKKSKIEDIAEAAIESFSSMAKEKGVDLILKKPKAPVPPITMDSRKISLVFGNLIDNALNYTPKGGKVEVALENSGKHVTVSVRDNGIGIPEEDIKGIFTRFFRAKNAIRIKTDGTGLGLYIAKSIVKIHGGNMRVESEEGKGTVFYFTIPLHPEGEVRRNIEIFLKSI